MTIQELYEHYLKHRRVQTDTRKLQRGDIFFALKGPSFNGNEFAAQAIAQGASLAVVDEAPYVTNEQTIFTADALLALQELAQYHRQQLNIPFIAITGSNGKTTTKELLLAVLRQRYRTAATEGNLNNHIGVPLTILSMPPDTEMAIIEMGANHIGEIAGYCEIARPDVGLITNCGKAHIEGFGSEAGVRQGKGELYDWLRNHQGLVFRNADLSYLGEMAEGIAAQITYGGSDAAVTGQVAARDERFLSVDVQTPGGHALIHTRLVGAYNLSNVLAAVAVGHHFEVSLADIKSAIENYEPGNSRSQWMEKGGNRLVLDAYNANPGSMRAAIENFAGMPGQDKRLWLGAMKEMGDQCAAEHQALINLVRQHRWTEVILVGREFEALRSDYRWFENSAQAADYVAAHPPKDATILIKGSRGSKMEVLLTALEASSGDA